MDVLELLLYSLRLLPVSAGEAYDSEIFYRTQLAEACMLVSMDRTERFVCMKIARFESNYRMDVGECRVKGREGELSAWQILPRSGLERAHLCRSLAEDADLALERVRESRAACRHLPKDEQLALYTRGSCASDEGRRLSKHRWPYERKGEMR